MLLPTIIFATVRSVEWWMAAEETPSTDTRFALEGCEPYSFRADPTVPIFPDERPLIVFDGVCVLCSGFAQFVISRDTNKDFLLTHAQSDLGQALFQHYGLDTYSFETNLLIDDGLAYGRLEAMGLILRRLGWPWRAAMGLLWLPRPIGRWVYQRIARNRYAMFGRRKECWVPDGELRTRLIT